MGFGDYHPRSNIERLVGAAMLTFGVSIFSLAMSQFIEMIDKIKNFNEGLEDQKLFSQFFEVLQKFNKNLPIDDKLKT